MNFHIPVRPVLTQLNTASPRLTRFLGPEKNRVSRNRAIGGLWDYTMQKFKKIALERGIALFIV